MATIENTIEPKIAQSGHLLRILGVGFGLAAVSVEKRQRNLEG